MPVHATSAVATAAACRRHAPLPATPRPNSARKENVTWRAIVRQKYNVNVLSGARFFLFGSRDCWFEVRLAWLRALQRWLAAPPCQPASGAHVLSCLLWCSRPHACARCRCPSSCATPRTASAGSAWRSERCSRCARAGTGPPRRRAHMCMCAAGPLAPACPVARADQRCRPACHAARASSSCTARCSPGRRSWCCSRCARAPQTSEQGVPRTAALRRLPWPPRGAITMHAAVAAVPCAGARFVELLWNGLLCAAPAFLAAMVFGSPVFSSHDVPAMTGVLLAGLLLYCVLFAVNSSVHSYLIVKCAAAAPGTACASTRGALMRAVSARPSP